MRVWWNEYTYLIMWTYVYEETNMYIWLCKDTGAMNRPPTPDGVFATCFVGVCGIFRL